MGAWVKNGNIRGPLGGTFPDAPSDGLVYARQSAAWVPTVPEAPSDDYPYVRMQETWIPGVWAAPADGKTYAQKDANWTEINVDTGTIGNLPGARVIGFDAKAPLASPIFTGNPTGPTPALGDSSGSFATTSFVKQQGYTTAATVTSMLSTYAPLFSPIFTGNPTAPTPPTADNDTSIATTAFVKAQGYATTAQLGSYLPLAGGTLTGALTLGSGSLYSGLASGLALWARSTSDPTGGGHIGLRFTGHAPNPNGIDFYTGGTGTAAFSAALQIFADARALFTGNIETSGGAEVRASGSLVSNGPSYIRAASGGNSQLIFMSSASATLGLVYQSPSNGVLVLDNRFASTNQLLQLGTTGNLNLVGSTANLTIAGSVATKASGTTWANPSDARTKTIVGDFPMGLDEVRALQPRVFTYKGNYTYDDPSIDPYDPEAPPQNVQVPYPRSPHYRMAVDGTEVPGFIAQEVEASMPGMVVQGSGWIDGVEVNDFRTLDTSNLILAVVNAIKELADRVEVLEASG